MSIKLMTVVLISLLLSFGLGFVPDINESIHWHLWLIIPFGGLLFGILVGWIQFGICYLFNQKVNHFTLLILAVAATIGYALVDYGIYFSTTVHLKGVQGTSEGDYKLSYLISFWDYMSLRLGSSTISTRNGIKLYELGVAGTTLYYIIDLSVTFLVSLATLLVLTVIYPYCNRCSQFKRREKKYKIVFNYEENLGQEIFAKISELVQQRNYHNIVSYFRKLSEKYRDKNGNVKIVADQRFCQQCREASILGKVYRLKGGTFYKEWEEMSNLSFSFTSQPGEHSSLMI